jgi:hypothetical protein
MPQRTRRAQRPTRARRTRRARHGCLAAFAAFDAFLDAFSCACLTRLSRAHCTDCTDCQALHAVLAPRTSAEGEAPGSCRRNPAGGGAVPPVAAPRWRRTRSSSASVEFQRFWRDFCILAPFLFSVLRNTRDDLPRETGTSIRTHRRVFILVPFRSVPLCRSVLLLSLFRSVGNDICETSARDTTSTHNICPRHLPPASATFCHVYHYCDVCSACN